MRTIVADEWPISRSKHGISKRRRMGSVLRLTWVSARQTFSFFILIVGYRTEDPTHLSHDCLDEPVADIAVRRFLP